MTIVWLSESSGVTAIETDWLPMFVPTECRFSDPMKDPPPFYDSGKGSVMCYMSSTYGKCFMIFKKQL